MKNQIFLQHKIHYRKSVNHSPKSGNSKSAIPNLKKKQQQGNRHTITKTFLQKLFDRISEYLIFANAVHTAEALSRA